jgi:hypothetical protein
MVNALSEIVEAPPITPARYGLASVAIPQSTDGTHWQLGVAYEPDAVVPVGVLAGACTGPVTIDLAGAPGLVEGLPFAVYAGFNCPLIGEPDDEITQRAVTALDAGGWQRGAEQALWGSVAIDGLSSQFNKTSPDVVANNVDVVTAVAALEDTLGDAYLGQGVIHGKRGVSAFAAAHQLVEHEAGVAVTPAGSAWVFGAGYDGSGPDGSDAPAAGHGWLFATGKVTVRRGPALVLGTRGTGLDRSTNGTVRFVEQVVVLTVEGPFAAALVDFTA